MKLFIRAEILITMNSEDDVYEDGYVLSGDDGKVQKYGKFTKDIESDIIAN